MPPNVLSIMSSMSADRPIKNCTNSIKKENPITQTRAFHQVRTFLTATGNIKPNGRNINILAIDCVICFRVPIAQVSVMNWKGIRLRECSVASIVLPSNRQETIHPKNVAVQITKMQAPSRKQAICRNNGILFLRTKYIGR